MPPGGQRTIGRHVVISLCAACTGCIAAVCGLMTDGTPLPRRCLHGVHRDQITDLQLSFNLCLGAACTGCIIIFVLDQRMIFSLPRRCLHGVHPRRNCSRATVRVFASALPARGASAKADKLRHTIL